MQSWALLTITGPTSSTGRTVSAQLPAVRAPRESPKSHRCRAQAMGNGKRCLGKRRRSLGGPPKEDTGAADCRWFACTQLIVARKQGCPDPGR